MKKINPIYLLTLGAVFIALTHMRFGLGFLIFFESIPFLIYLERSQKFRSQALLFGVLFIGWSLATAKIITDPIPWFGVFGYALPISLFKYLPFLGFLVFKNNRYSEWIFPALLVIGEWSQASFTPFASWGSAAYTQINNLVWLQSVSVGGIWILSYLIYFISYQIYRLIRYGFSRELAVKMVIPALILSLFGTLRLTHAENSAVERVTVAMVGTNSTIGSPVIPSIEERQLTRSRIYGRMRIASQAGARLIVWTEAATAVLPEEELIFQGEVSQLSDQLNITSVVCYVVLESTNPFQYKNKYILIDSSGQIQSTYHKHEPVPGEPCKKGVEPHQVYDLEGMSVGGAICYDFDFPHLSRAISKLDADIVAVPSSDWRGIDPIHTQMAAIRAIEGGFSLVRSTRWGLSAAVDPYGRVIGQLSDFNSNEKILISNIPRHGQTTIYSVMGDWVITISLIILIVGLLERFRHRRAKTGL